MQGKLKYPAQLPPDKDKFLDGIRSQLIEVDEELIEGTLSYLVRNTMPPERQIEGIRYLYRTTFISYKEKLRDYQTDSLKNKSYINELIAFSDELIKIAANIDMWITSNFRELAKPKLAKPRTNGGGFGEVERVR